MTLFLFNRTPTPEIYTLSLHDALPICAEGVLPAALLRGEIERDVRGVIERELLGRHALLHRLDRKSTRLNSSHGYISYAVFCLKKKKKLIKPLIYIALSKQNSYYNLLC